jgi:hypothetical protein
MDGFAGKIESLEPFGFGQREKIARVYSLGKNLITEFVNISVGPSRRKSEGHQ